MSYLVPGELKPDEALKAIAKAEDMIQRFRDMDYVLKPEARTILFQSQVSKEKETLSDQLWRTFAVYEDAKCKYPSDTDSLQISLRFNFAHMCLIMIDRALMSGVVEEGQGLARKLRECQAENAGLKADNEALSEAHQGLLQRFPDLRNHGSEDRRLP